MGLCLPLLFTFTTELHFYIFAVISKESWEGGERPPSVCGVCQLEPSCHSNLLAGQGHEGWGGGMCRWQERFPCAACTLSTLWGQTDVDVDPSAAAYLIVGWREPDA